MNLESRFSEMEYGIQPAVVDQIVKALQSACATEDVEMIDIHSLTTAHESGQFL